MRIVPRHFVRSNVDLRRIAVQFVGRIGLRFRRLGHCRLFQLRLQLHKLLFESYKSAGSFIKQPCFGITGQNFRRIPGIILRGKSFQRHVFDGS